MNFYIKKGNAEIFCIMKGVFIKILREKPIQKESKSK